MSIDPRILQQRQQEMMMPPFANNMPQPPQSQQPPQIGPEQVSQAILQAILSTLGKGAALDVEVQSKAVLTYAQAFAQLNPPQQAQGISPQDQLRLAQEKQAHEQLLQREKLAMDQQKHQQDMQLQQEKHNADLANQEQQQALQADQHNHQKQLQTEKLLMDHEIAKTRAAQQPAQKGE